MNDTLFAKEPELTTTALAPWCRVWTMSKHTPGPWEARDAAGAGWQIHGVLPEGLQFDCTCHGADGKTWFMLYTLRQSVMVGIGDERWVQFETGQWKEMQRANSHLIAAAPDLLEACKEFVGHYPRGINPFLDEARVAAMAAIAKAEAEAP